MPLACRLVVIDLSQNGLTTMGISAKIESNHNATEDGVGVWEEMMPARILVVDDEPPIVEVLVYNLKRNNPRNFDISVYDSYGRLQVVTPRRVKIYKDEIRIKVRVEDMEASTYFYTVTYSDRTLINGKLNMHSYAQYSQ